jgi:hypothetical protein
MESRRKWFLAQLESLRMERLRKTLSPNWNPIEWKDSEWKDVEKRLAQTGITQNGKTQNGKT